MENTLVIIDGNSLMNRAYYAIQRPMITKEGMYTQGIFGFLNMLNKILTDYEPSHIAVAFDRKAPTFRHMEYTDYKAGRKKMPPELAMEFPVLKEILTAMNIKLLEIDGFEADDILGTVSRIAEEENIKPYIITGDKDAFQLASDSTTIIFTKRGTSEFDVYDEKAVFDKYGFSPLQFIDFKGLMGDQSDNIPGIPGVGEKTATKLILEYGSVENLINSLDSMKASKLKDKIEENAQLAVMSRRLAEINRYVPIEIDFGEMEYKKPDYDKLTELYKKLEFNSFLKKLSASNKMPTSGAYKSESNPKNYINENSASLEQLEQTIYTDICKISEDIQTIHIENAGDLSSALEEIKKSSLIWLKIFHDNNHKAQPEISSICIAADDKFYIIHWQSDYTDITSEFFAEYNGKICGHDLKSDYYSLISNGAAKLGEGKAVIFNTYYDTAIAAYLIDPQKKSYELSVLMLENFHQNFPSDKEIAENISAIDLFGAIYDNQAKMGLMIFQAASSLILNQTIKLTEMELTEVYEDVELPLIEVLASMESAGIKADANALNEIGDALKERISELTEMIYAMAGEEFNINSPKQLGSILFEKLNLKNGKKTKTGYSTSAEILEKIADDHAIVPLILEYRMITKLNGTYVEGMLPLIDANGFIHAHFQQTVTTTGRLSCTEPNLQNIPIRQELGRQFRKIFTSSAPNRVLVGADYSQIELRVMAHLSEDEALIEAFAEKSDIHTATAARVFNTAPEEVTPLQRSRAKAVNFGVIYGISAFGLSEDLKISRAEAQDYIDQYFDKHPKVKTYMNDMVQFCRDNNYVTTIKGRRRNINEIHASNYMTRQLGERLAMNTPVQGSAADIMKIAMIKVYETVNTSLKNCRLVLQVHDELLIDAPSEEKEKVEELLESCMNNAVLLKVPLAADVNSGINWFELK